MTLAERFEIRKQSNMVVDGKKVTGYVVVDNESNKILTKPMDFKSAFQYRDSMIKTNKGESNE